MILRPKLLRHAPVAVTSAGSAAPAATVPSWLRAAAAGPESIEDAAFGAAAATAKRAGRVEDAAALRDARLLTRPGDAVGPAGRMLLAWRTLASRPVEILTGEATLGEVGADLGSSIDEEAVGRLADEIERIDGAHANAVGAAADAIALRERHGHRTGRELGP